MFLDKIIHLLSKAFVNQYKFSIIKDSPDEIIFTRQSYDHDADKNITFYFELPNLNYDVDVGRNIDQSDPLINKHISIIAKTFADIYFKQEQTLTETKIHYLLMKKLLLR